MRLIDSIVLTPLPTPAIGCRTTWRMIGPKAATPRVMRATNLSDRWARPSRIRFGRRVAVLGWSGRVRSRLGRDGFQVEQEQGQLNASDAIRQRMVKLHDQCSPAVLEVFHERELPQRTGTVELLACRRTSDCHHRVPRGRRRRFEATEVPRQVEPVVDRPSWGGESERRYAHSLSEARDHPRCPIELGDESVPIRGTLQPGNDDNGRAQRLVGLHVPGERVAFPHEPAHPRLPSAGHVGPTVNPIQALEAAPQKRRTVSMGR